MAADPETLVPILDPSSRPLDRSLHRLDSFLSLLGFVTFASASPPRIALSCSAFVVWGIAAPSAAIYLSRRSSCSFQYQVEWFEICDLVSQASLAAVSLVCISKNLYKFGIRKFMFVDPLHGEVQRFQNEYVRKIQVSSIVQVVGVVLCLHSAAKITHKAQGVAAIASNWHAWITCSSECSHSRGANGSGNLGFIPAIRMPMVSSESDLESLDNVTLHNTGHMSPYLPSYHKRQALVLYLQSNPGGITIFGWAVDRGLINTIFFIELSLVLFVLGKTIVLAK